MRNTIDSMSFESKLVLEFSSIPMQQPIGKAKNTMTLLMDEDGESGAISWEYDFLDDSGNPDGDGGEVGIGLWFDGKTLTDYDGVASLPEQAVALLKRNGYILEWEPLTGQS